MISNAVKKGSLKKFPCLVCGEKNDVEAHHWDYSKPLDVLWLCPVHHKWVHKEAISAWELHNRFADCHASPEDGCEGCAKYQEQKGRRKSLLQKLDDAINLDPMSLLGK